MSAARALGAALLRREFATRAAHQRLLLVMSVGIVAGAAAGGLDAQGNPPSIAALLLPAQLWLALGIGMTAALRVVGHIRGDERDGWLAQFFAAGRRRDEYVALVGLASLLAAWVEYLASAGLYVALRAVVAGAPPLAALGTLQLGALIWLPFAVALGSAAAVLFRDATRGRALVLLVLPLPFLVAVAAFVLGIDPDPGRFPFSLTWLIPQLIDEFRLGHLGRVLVGAGIAFGIAWLLAPARVDRVA